MSFFQQFLLDAPSGAAAIPHADALGKMGCRVCPLAKGKNANQGMPPSDAVKPMIYVIGDAPSAEENRSGVPFTSPSNSMVRTVLSDLLSPQGVDYKREVRFNNIVRTRPPNDRAPTATEIACCRPSVVDDIVSTAPKRVIVMGDAAVAWAGLNSAGCSAWRGRRVVGEFGGHKCWVYPVEHPRFIQRNGGMNGAAGAMFRRDIAAVVKDLVDLPPLPTQPSQSEIESKFVLLDKDITGKKVEAALKRFEGRVVAFDLETHNHDRLRDTFRPYSQDARVLSIAISDGDSTVALLVDHPSVSNPASRKDAINNIAVKKAVSNALAKCKRAIAHNLPFDLEWLGVHVMPNFIEHESIWACTRAQAYVIDNRPGLHSLNDLSFIYFGHRVKQNVPVDVANLIAAPIDTLLRYNAHDAWITRRLWDAQEAVIESNGLTAVAESQHGRVPTLVAASIKGLELDGGAAMRLGMQVRRSIKDAKSEVHSHAEVVKWQAKNHMPFSMEKKEHLIDLLQNFCHIDLPKTAKGNPSLSAKAVSNIDHPIIKQINRVGELETLLGTFVSPLQPNGKHVWADGKVHPQFNPTRTITRRLSSSSPNGQNFPKRRGEYIRDIIRAPEGHKIVSCDFGQMEARFIAADSQDKTFCDAVISGYDIHAAWGSRIAAAYPQWEITDPKEQRNTAKGGMVFASFYKATPPTIAAACKIPVGVAEMLLREFWREFAGVAEWHQRLISTYQRNGYIELASGFRCHGLFNQWQAVNYRVQGSASDVVVRAMRVLTKESVRLRRPQLQAALNIHDDLTFYLPEETLAEDVEIISRVMLERPPFFRQIPLAIEISTGDAWGSMSEYAVMNEGDLT